jgi:hypothetical protein
LASSARRGIVPGEPVERLPSVLQRFGGWLMIATCKLFPARTIGESFALAVISAVSIGGTAVLIVFFFYALFNRIR